MLANTEIMEQIKDHIIERASEISPICGIMMKNAGFECKDGVLTISLKTGEAFILGTYKIDAMINEAAKGSGMDRAVILETSEGPASAPTSAPALEFPEPPTVVINMPQSTQRNTKKSAKQPYAPSGFKPRQKRGSKKLLKTEIKGVITKLCEEIEESDEILFDGFVINFERRETRTERLMCKMDVTDGTDSITVKFFLKDEEEFKDGYAAVTEPGKAVRILGQARYDDFSKEINIMAKEIAPLTIKKDGRKDISIPEDKRVELHLHTQMSQMDATNSAEDYIKRAAEWGMPAVALTDHGVVQAFPDAMAAARKHGIKVIYGMEAYLVDDLWAIVQNPGDRGLNETFVVFDVETTGLDKDDDSIIEIGAVRVEGGVITDSFNALVNPGFSLPAKIVKLTGITDGTLAGEPDISAVLPGFLEFARGAVLCAHNAVFDMGFIDRAVIKTRAYGEAPGERTVLCTLELSRALFPEVSGHSLKNMAKHLGVTLTRHHRAVDDAKATAGILIKCLEMLKERGITRLRDINPLGGGVIDIKKLPYHHAIILAKNAEGLRNLYELTSRSHLEFFFKRPRIPKSLLAVKREGLILGTACEAGELYTAVLNNASEERICELAQFYDYLEIQCHENNMYLYRSERVPSVEALKEINKRIVALGDE
ncbi:MAG: PHP domain-containing protein, partial [Clostridiales bacterium]|nr:PHP domain-containing protein [Clostridiales bacterium]